MTEELFSLWQGLENFLRSKASALALGSTHQLFSGY